MAETSLNEPPSEALLKPAKKDSPQTFPKPKKPSPTSDSPQTLPNPAMAKVLPHFHPDSPLRSGDSGRKKMPDPQDVLSGAYDNDYENEEQIEAIAASRRM